MYQGDRRFLGLQPTIDGVPQISLQFSTLKANDPLKLFVPFNFDAGDPVQVFTGVGLTAC